MPDALSLLRNRFGRLLPDQLAASPGQDRERDSSRGELAGSKRKRGTSSRDSGEVFLVTRRTESRRPCFATSFRDRRRRRSRHVGQRSRGRRYRCNSSFVSPVRPSHLSVPFSCVTCHCSGVRRFRASSLSTAVVILLIAPSVCRRILVNRARRGTSNLTRGDPTTLERSGRTRGHAHVYAANFAALNRTEPRCELRVATPRSAPRGPLDWRSSHVPGIDIHYRS